MGDELQGVIFQTDMEIFTCVILACSAVLDKALIPCVSPLLFNVCGASRLDRIRRLLVNQYEKL